MGIMGLSRYNIKVFEVFEKKEHQQACHCDLVSAQVDAAGGFASLYKKNKSYSSYIGNI